MKEGEKKMKIENWFLNKNFTENETLVIEQDDYTIISETDKAIKVRFMSDYGNLTRWLPKTVVCCEEVKTTNKKEIKTKAGEIKEIAFMDRNIVTTTDGKKYMKFAIEFI